MWMPKLWLGMIGLICLPLLNAQEPFDPQAYKQFLYKMDLFNRKLVGCPLKPDVIHIEDCRPAQGTFDAKLWKEIQKAAPRALSLPRKVLPKDRTKRGN